MDLNQRQSEILGLIRDQGFASIDGMARQFDVTPQTIRRDINQMCEQQLLQRHHGGASLASSVENVAYSTRQSIGREDKMRIGQMVADHIPNNASLFINIGTTTEEVARSLLGHRGLRVITNNLNVANILTNSADSEVIIAGGVVRNRDGGIVGGAAANFISQFKVDIGVIGISGIDTDGSLLDFDYREVEVAKAIMSNSRQVFLATDSSKFGRNAMVRLGHISQLSAVFTDHDPPDWSRQILSAADVNLHVAESV